MPSTSRNATAPIPDFRPQLAQLAKQVPSGDAWLHEQKFDGYRIGCRIDGKHVRLISRTDHDWTDKFVPVCDAARALGVQRALLDGEVAAVLPNGLTSFQALQNSFRGVRAPNLVYFAFDLLFLDGDDLTGRPLEERKARLQALLQGPRDARSGLIRFSDHVVGDGAAFLRGACGMGMEGIVCKRRDQPYTEGRNGGWLKIKCTKRQELVVGGFTEPEGARHGIGALLVGYYDGDKRFIFAGRVGTGFTEKVALDLRRRLDAIERKQSPFQGGPVGTLPRVGVHWTAPRLVCEVKFGEWTDEGSLRHPSFQGLRLDKDPADVVREVPR